MLSINLLRIARTGKLSIGVYTIAMSEIVFKRFMRDNIHSLSVVASDIAMTHLCFRLGK